MSFSNLLSSRISGDGSDGLAGMLQKRLTQNKSNRWVRKGDKDKKEEKKAKRVLQVLSEISSKFFF